MTDPLDTLDRIELGDSDIVAAHAEARRLMQVYLDACEAYAKKPNRENALKLHEAGQAADKAAAKYADLAGYDTDVIY